MAAITIFFFPERVSAAPRRGPGCACDGECLLLAGNGTRYDLTPVTAVSVHLLGSDGAPVLVDGPIYVTVPLATHSSLRHNAYVAAWRFDRKLGKRDSRLAGDWLTDDFVTGCGSSFGEACASLLFSKVRSARCSRRVVWIAVGQAYSTVTFRVLFFFFFPFLHILANLLAT